MLNNRKSRSVYMQIWSITFGMLLLFMFLLILLNALYINRSKEKFITYQLNNILNEKINIETQKIESSYTFFSGVQFMILGYDNNTFFLMKEERSDHKIKKEISSNEFNDNELLIFEELKSLSIIQQLTESSATTAKTTNDHGHFSKGHFSYYYKVIAQSDPLSGDPILFVAYTMSERNIGEFSSYLIAFFLSLLISIGITRIVAKRFSHSLSELEDFAGEIAHHRWNTIVPTSPTLEIQRLSHSLSEMRDILKETDEREKEFIQSGSHNLKTPVMVIKGYAQGILDGMLKGSEEKAAHIILQEAQQLQKKITQMLHMLTYQNRNDSAEPKEIIRLDRLVHHVATKFDMVRPGLNWQEDLSPIEIFGYSESLIIAFENLFENQIRYAQSIVKISFMPREQEILLLIANDGPPFSVKNPEALFEKFKKDASGQWGLGLYIVQQIINVHGGTIRAYNNSDHTHTFEESDLSGVSFEIHLPIPTQYEIQSDHHFEEEP